MAGVVDKQFIFDTIQSKKYYFWIVRKGDIIIYEYEGGADYNQSTDELRKLLEALSPGTYNCRVRKAMGANNTGATAQKYCDFDVMCSKSPSATPVAGVPGNTNVNVDNDGVNDKYLELVKENQKLTREAQLKADEERFKGFTEVIAAQNQKLLELQEMLTEEDEEEETEEDELDLLGDDLNMQKEIAGFMKDMRPIFSAAVADKIKPGSGDLIFKKALAGDMPPVTNLGNNKTVETQRSTEPLPDIKTDDVKIQEQLKYISEAAKILLAIDGNAGKHYLELAQFAKQNPDGYNFGVTYVQQQLKKPSA